MVGIKNFLLVCLALLVSIILSEMVLIALNIGGYSLNDRVLFYSFPAFTLDANKAVRYAPATNIRIVAVYGEYIDIDKVSRTNNLGFYDSRDYTQTSMNGHDVVFIGDSFTAGTGGSRPWIEWLREMGEENNGTTQFYNLGIAGTGVQHFFRLLTSFQKEIEFDEVNIMVITDDLFRSFWYPVEGKDQLWFCDESDDPEACMKKRRPIINKVDINEATSSILERANRLYAQKNLEAGRVTGIFGDSRLYALLCDAYSLMDPQKKLQKACAHLKVHGYRSYQKDDRYQSAILTLRSIAEYFSGVKFRVFHIPEKGEVFSGKYSLDIKHDINRVGMEYIPLLNSCEWRRNMFHKHDSHPNDYGYINLAGCVARHIED
jgi:hypothetical protein